MTLEQKYDRCKVNVLELTNENLSNARTNRYPMAAYYRLLLAKLIPDLQQQITKAHMEAYRTKITDVATKANENMWKNLRLLLHTEININ